MRATYFAPAQREQPAVSAQPVRGSLGGPVVRNRTFFFADYEGRRARYGSHAGSPTCLPQLERMGDFSRSTSMPSILSPSSRSPIVRFRRTVSSGRAGDRGVVSAAEPVRGRSRITCPRRRCGIATTTSTCAWTISWRSSDIVVSATASATENCSSRSAAGLAAVPGYGNNVPRRAQNAMASETHVFTPALLNELRARLQPRVAWASFQQNIGTQHQPRGRACPTLSSNPRDFGLSRDFGHRLLAARR